MIIKKFGEENEQISRLKIGRYGIKFNLPHRLLPFPIMFFLKIKGSYAFLIPTYSIILTGQQKAMIDEKTKSGKKHFWRCYDVIQLMETA